jgi:hypothetical protein
VHELKAWLHRITRNEALVVLRCPEYDFDELNESLGGVPAPEDAEPDRRVLIRETLTSVSALPELQRQAIVRTAVDGRSYEEVGTALGLSVNSVRGLVYRARRSLRAGLAALSPAPIRELLRSGSAGGGIVAIKGATVLATSVVVVGGTVTGGISHLPPGRTAPQAAHAEHVRSRASGSGLAAISSARSSVASGASNSTLGSYRTQSVWHGSPLEPRRTRARISEAGSRDERESTSPAKTSASPRIQANAQGAEPRGASPRPMASPTPTSNSGWRAPTASQSARYGGPMGNGPTQMGRRASDPRASASAADEPQAEARPSTAAITLVHPSRFGFESAPASPRPAPPATPA